VTLDDLERPFYTLFQNACVFGAHHRVYGIVSGKHSEVKRWVLNFRGWPIPIFTPPR